MTIKKSKKFTDLSLDEKAKYHEDLMKDLLKGQEEFNQLSTDEKNKLFKEIIDPIVYKTGNKNES